VDRLGCGRRNYLIEMTRNHVPKRMGRNGMVLVPPVRIARDSRLSREPEALMGL
jgi:hypothetical protein